MLACLTSAAIGQWVHELAGLSDEDQAWAHVKAAEGPTAASFQAGLSYLMEHGSPATLQKLTQVFLEAAAERDLEGSGLLDPLKILLKKLGPAADDFGRKFLATAKQASEEGARLQSAAYVALPPELLRRDALRAATQLKVVEQIALRRTVAPLLEEYAGARAEDRACFLPALRSALDDEEEGAGASAIYRAAASAPQECREELLMLLDRDAGAGRPDAPATLEIFRDPATRAAAESLLHDCFGLYATRLDPFPKLTIADLTAALVLLRLPPRERHSEVEMEGRWSHEAALATVAGTARPPAPDPSKVPKELTDRTLASWSDLAPVKILAALHELPEDRQMAVKSALEQKPVWARPLIDAQLRIDYLRPGCDPGLPLQRWVGRQFDGKLRGEILAELERQIREGHCYAVCIESAGPLSGLILSAKADFDWLGLTSLGRRYSLEGLENRPPPDFVLVSRFDFLRRKARGEDAAVMRPFWKDPAVDAAWRQELGGHFPLTAPVPDFTQNAAAVEKEKDALMTVGRPASYGNLLARAEKGEVPVILQFHFVLCFAAIFDDRRRSPPEQFPGAIPELPQAR